MVFNCFNAPFAVTSWTGKEHPFEKLPLVHASAHHDASSHFPTGKEHPFEKLPLVHASAHHDASSHFPTGKEHPFEKLPLEVSFDLLLKSNRKKKVC